MAIFHYSARLLSRKKGRSSVAASAYRSGTRLTDERTGQVHNYSKKRGIDVTEILSPRHAPEWVNDRTTLWNKVESAEKRKDAQVAREIIVALPRELNRVEQLALTRSFVAETFVQRGMVADVAWHKLESENPHAHILLTTRSLHAEGFGPKRREWNDKAFLKSQRQGWAQSINTALARKGLKERVSHETLKAQGVDRKAQKHLGKAATALERKGINTRPGNYNRKVKREYDRMQAQAKRAKKQKRFHRKMAFLYATHQISRKTYLKYTKGTGLPKTKYGIIWAEATGQISKKHANYLRSQLARQEKEQAEAQAQALRDQQQRQRQQAARKKAQPKPPSPPPASSYYRRPSSKEQERERE